MPDLPLVSIVTPSFNQGRFIRETIESVLGQDHPRIEYVVVDGGSTDDTLDILREYGSRLKWMSEPDRGQASAVNKGWRMTRGEIIAWLNSDDTYLPGAVQAAVEFLQQRPEIDVVYGDCDYVDAAGRCIGRYPTRTYERLQFVRSVYNYIPQSATFIRRSVLRDVGFLDESLHYVLDFDFWLRVGMKHQFAYMRRRIATWRLHSSTKTVDALARIGPELIRVYEKLFAAAELPAEVRAVQASAMSTAHYRAASHYLMSGHPAEARRHAQIGWRYAPLNLQRTLFKVILLSNLGALGLWIARKLSSDPSSLLARSGSPDRNDTA